MGKPKKIVEIPEGEVRLPAAENMFEATTIYFGKNPAVSLVCDSRAEAELLAAIAREGVSGPISIPTTEEAASSTNASKTASPAPRHTLRN
jgi:hypothetical protein